MALSTNTSGTYTITRVDAAESTIGWSVVKLEGGGGTPTAVNSVGSTDLFREGSNAVETVVNKTRIVMYHTDSGGYDFTSGSTGTGGTKIPNGNIYIWAKFLASGALLTKATGGLQIEYSSTSGAPTVGGAGFINVAGSDTYDGNFIKFATTITKAIDEGASQTIGDIVNFGIVADVGATTTRFDNFIVDAIDVGTGLSFNGTTTTNSLFSEAYDVDETTAIGVLSRTNGIIFAQGSISFDGTAMTSDSETLVFTDTLQEAYTYNLDITGTVTFTNSSVSSDGAVDYVFDTSSATSFTMNGGALSNFSTLNLASGQTISGAVFQAGGTSTIAANPSNCAFNSCGEITLTGTASGCTVNEAALIANEGAMIVSDLARVGNTSFIRGTNGHAVELTSIGGGSMTWNGFLSGYRSGGVGGSPVTPTSFGDEAIYVNVGSGTLTINVTSGADTPSIRSAGATVNVVAAGGSYQFTVSPLPSPNYEWRIYTVTATGSLAGAVEVAGAENETSVTPSAYSHQFTNQVAAVQIISADYEERTEYITLNSSTQTPTIFLEIDNND